MEKVTSVSDFIQKLKMNFEALQSPGEFFSFWFRGEPKNDLQTPLVPKAFRDLGVSLNSEDLNSNVFDRARSIELTLKGHFHREATPYLSREGIDCSAWNEYYLMQQYGLKTRLLDWTENALFALFNAVADHSYQNDDARLWILNPNRLNGFTTKTISNQEIHRIYSPRDINERRPLLEQSSNMLDIDELYRRYLHLDFDIKEENIVPEYFPLALYPPLLNERMSVQASCFTIFGNKVNGLLSAKKSNDFLAHVIVDAASKHKIQEELRWMGISHKNLSPGLDGICRTIGDYYENKIHL